MSRKAVKSEAAPTSQDHMERAIKGEAGWLASRDERLVTAARLSEIAGRVGGNSQAALIAGVSRNTIYDWSKGNKRVPLHEASLLARAANVSLDWIAGGGDERPQRETRGGDTNLALADYVPVPRLDVRASAGLGLATIDGDQAETPMMMRRSWLRMLGIAPQNAELLLLEGDSMEPTIPDGALILVDRGYSRVIDGGIFALVTNGLVIVKRVQLLAVGGFVLISDNPRYPPQAITGAEANDVRFEARVVWYGRAI